MHRSSFLLIALAFAAAINAQTPAPAPTTVDARLLTAEKMWSLKRLGDPAPEVLIGRGDPMSAGSVNA